MNATIISKMMHMIHLGKQKDIIEFIITCLSSDYILCHPGSLSRNRHPFWLYKIHILSASNYMLEEI